MSSVSRSVYQKKHEECKRLLADIRILIKEWPILDKHAYQSKRWLAVFSKWDEEFCRQQKIDDVMTELFSHYRKSKIKQQHEK